MSYLLGYQKWRKLNESAQYKKIYEQEQNASFRPVFVLLAGTDKNRTNDAINNERLGSKINPFPNAAQGKANRYQMSLKDALLGNFDKAEVIGTTNYEDINDRDYFEVDGKVAKGSSTIQFNHIAGKETIIKFSGNGALAIARAAVELKNKSYENIASKLDNYSAVIKLYLSQEEDVQNKFSTVGDNPRFSKLLTIVGSGVDTVTALFSKISSGILAPVLHYLTSDAAVKAKIEAGEKMLKTSAYPNKQLTNNPLWVNYLDEGAIKLFFGSQEIFSDLDQYKNKQVSELTEIRADKNIYLKDDIKSKIFEYIKLAINNFSKDDGTVYQFFIKQNQSSKTEVEPELIKILVKTIAAISADAMKDVNTFNKELNTKVKIYYGDAQTKTGPSTPIKTIGSTQSGSTFASGSTETEKK